MPAHKYGIRINADKTPAGQHVGRFNALSFGDEVAIVLLGKQFNSIQQKCQTNKLKLFIYIRTLNQSIGYEM